MRRGIGTRWLWGALALVAAVVLVVILLRMLPNLKVGDVDPLGALIGSVSLLVAGASLYLAVRALRPPQSTLAEAAAALALAVKHAESAARRQLLGDHDKPIDVDFTLQPAPGHRTAARRQSGGAPGRSHLARVAGYYRELSPRRLVITGAPGAGKTVLAVELILTLVEGRAEGEPVPVRISAALLDTDLPTTNAVDAWLATHLMEVYHLKKAAAHALIHARLVTPVIDGLDEMDAATELGYDSRAGRALRALNAYQDGRAMAAVVLTCRSSHYEALEELRVWAQDAARVELSPVNAGQTRAFLTARTTEPARWEPVLAAIKRAPRGPLADGLSTPWRLTLATVVYEERDPSGDFVRDPVELTDTALDTAEAVRDHLLSLLIPATLALNSAPGDVDPVRVHRWLASLAGYLDRNATTGRSWGERPLSSTNLVLHELWPLAGIRLPRALAVAATAIPALLLLGPRETLSSSAVISLAGILMLAWYGWAAHWPQPARANPRRLRTPAGRRQFAGTLPAAIAAGLPVGLGAWLDSGLAAGLAAGLTIGFGAWLVVGFGFGSTSGTANTGDPRDVVRDNFAFGFIVGLAAGLMFLLAVWFAYGYWNTDGLADWLGDGGGLANGLAVGLLVGLVFGLGLPGLRYLALLACTRRWNAIWLPWRLGRFLHWAYHAGLLRIAGIAYQFRHRELQDYLARNPIP